MQRNGTWQASFSNKIVMYWDQHQYKKTVLWDSRTNTGYLRSAPGAFDYQAYCVGVDADNDDETNEHACFQSNTDGTHLVSDHEEEGPTTSSATNPEITANGMREENIAGFMTKDLKVQPANVIEDEDEPLAAENPQADGTTNWDTSPLHAFTFLLSSEPFLKSYLLSRPPNVLDARMEQ
jgi:hypothetical protein